MGRETHTAVSDLRQSLDVAHVEDLLRHGGEPGLSLHKGIPDDYLSRWLRAEKGNVQKAATRLAKHAEWRASYVPKGAISKAEVARELAAEKAFLQGTDRQGRPLVVMVGRRHVRHKNGAEDVKRFMCYCLDTALSTIDESANPDGTLVYIFDLQGFSMNNFDPASARRAFELLQQHYPERVGMLWFYEPSVIFKTLWKLVSQFVDPATKAKVRIISKATAPSQLLQYFDPEVLPTEFGGHATLVPLR